MGDDGTLRMRPVEELRMLRSDEKTWTDLALADGEVVPLDGVVGDANVSHVTAWEMAPANPY